MEEKGKFPPRVPLAGKSYVWPEEGIDAWLENKRAAREEAIARH
jgi:predicted DNA-binding transcriptional regulator AlpA